MFEYFKKKKAESEKRAAELEAKKAEERAAAELAERKAKEEAAYREKYGAEDDALAAAKAIYDHAFELYLKHDYDAAVKGYTDAYNAGYCLAALSLHNYYRSLAEGKLRYIPVYDRDLAQVHYKKAYQWAYDAVASLQKQNAKHRGSKYEEKYFGFTVKEMHVEVMESLAELFFYGNGTDRDFGKALKVIKVVQHEGSGNRVAKLKDKVEIALDIQFFLKHEDDWDWASGAEPPEPFPEGSTLAGILYSAGESYRDGTYSEKDADKAFRLFKYLADNKYLLGYYGLGGCFEHGIGTAPDIEEAISWYYKAAQEETIPILFDYVSALKKADRDPEEAYRICEYLHCRSYMPATVLLAEMNEDGFGIKKNPENAMRIIGMEPYVMYLRNSAVRELFDFYVYHYRKELENGRSPEDLYLSAKFGILPKYKGVYLQRRSYTPDDEKMAMLTALTGTPLQDKAEEAMYALYTYGLKDVINYELDMDNQIYNYLLFHRNGKCLTESFRLGLILAERGDARAMYQTGMRYYHGIGTEKNAQEAERWLAKALENGYEDADKALEFIADPGDFMEQNSEFMKRENDHRFRAWAFHLGRGVEFNEGKALRELELLAEEGDPDVLARIARFYYDGPLTFHDSGRALELAVKAGKAGSAYGYWLAGKISEEYVISVSKYALGYYLLAEQMGDKRAGKRARELEAKNSQNYEKGLQKYNEKKYKDAYDYWYSCCLEKDKRVMLPMAEIISAQYVIDIDHLGCIVFPEAYRQGEKKYAGDACRSFWFDTKTNAQEAVWWGLCDRDLTLDEKYILSNALRLCNRVDEADKMLAECGYAGLYIAQYDLAKELYDSNNLYSLQSAKMWIEMAMKNDSERYDPTGYYSPKYLPEPDRLNRLIPYRLEALEHEEAERRAEEERLALGVERYNREQAARKVSQSRSQQAVNDIFGEYELMDKYGNKYTYNPATGRMSGNQLSGSIDLSGDEARRMALEHMYNISY